ncbi:g4006 [Coccomyxa viridis]|uniref:anthranilate synthase n=1 Tax=Coccomyxa viridis TaxID=1274662 RepID=A0ABP1FP77_9CHLO
MNCCASNPLLDTCRGYARLRHKRRRPMLRAQSFRCHAAANGKPQGPVVLVDNYDSFTYNLSQYLGDLGCEHVVFKNDEKTVEEIASMNPRGILVSPGPGRPEDSGISLQIVEQLGPRIPVFGVCMGHQCIGQIFGGRIIRAPGGVMHGKTSLVYHNNTSLMKGLDNPFQAARYHSLVIDKDSCPDDLEVTAWTEDGIIMGVQHRQHAHIQGVQFHPESVITDRGKTIVQNFIDALES